MSVVNPEIKKTAVDRNYRLLTMLNKGCYDLKENIEYNTFLFLTGNTPTLIRFCLPWAFSDILLKESLIITENVFIRDYPDLNIFGYTKKSARSSQKSNGHECYERDATKFDYFFNDGQIIVTVENWMIRKQHVISYAVNNYVGLSQHIMNRKSSPISCSLTT